MRETELVQDELITELRAENERLRAALREVIDDYDANLSDPPWTVAAIEDARKLVIARSNTSYGIIAANALNQQDHLRKGQIAERMQSGAGDYVVQQLEGEAWITCVGCGAKPVRVKESELIPGYLCTTCSPP